MDFSLGYVLIFVAFVVACFLVDRSWQKASLRRERERRQADAADPRNRLALEVQAAVDRQLVEPKMSLPQALRLMWKAFKGEPLNEVKL